MDTKVLEALKSYKRGLERELRAVNTLLNKNRPVGGVVWTQEMRDAQSVRMKNLPKNKGKSLPDKD